jgi:hypothetical protein
LISSVVAFIRSAKNRSASGGMALSCSETRNQDGRVSQPAAGLLGIGHKGFSS